MGSPCSSQRLLPVEPVLAKQRAHRTDEARQRRQQQVVKLQVEQAPHNQQRQDEGAEARRAGSANGSLRHRSDQPAAASRRRWSTAGCAPAGSRAAAAAPPWGSGRPRMRVVGRGRPGVVAQHDGFAALSGAVPAGGDAAGATQSGWVASEDGDEVGVRRDEGGDPHRRQRPCGAARCRAGGGPSAGMVCVTAIPSSASSCTIDGQDSRARQGSAGHPTPASSPACCRGWWRTGSRRRRRRFQDAW